MSRQTLHVVRGGVEKTRLLIQRILEGSLQPDVREVAVELVRTCPRNAHMLRLERLHRFVRSVVDYHREPIETFQSASYTLHHGGDCDCLTILLGAMGWSLRYPFAVLPFGDLDDPEHYALWLGDPPHDCPTGDEHTHWTPAEVSVQARFGEPTEAAGARRAEL